MDGFSCEGRVICYLLTDVGGVQRTQARVCPEFANLSEVDILVPVPTIFPDDYVTIDIGTLLRFIEATVEIFSRRSLYRHG